MWLIHIPFGCPLYWGGNRNICLGDTISFVSKIIIFPGYLKSIYRSVFFLRKFKHCDWVTDENNEMRRIRDDRVVQKISFTGKRVPSKQWDW